MTVFFYICEYFKITPKEFFDIDDKNPQKTKELISATKGMKNEELELLISVAKGLKK